MYDFSSILNGILIIRGDLVIFSRHKISSKHKKINARCLIKGIDRIFKVAEDETKLITLGETINGGSASLKCL